HCGSHPRRQPDALRNLLFARAVSNGAKWYCPDVFAGNPVSTPDEIDPAVRLDPETGAMLSPPAGPVLEAAGVGPESATDIEALRAKVVALLAETNTDLPKFLAYYRAHTIGDLTPEQCAEAIQVLTARKNAHQVSLLTS